MDSLRILKRMIDVVPQQQNFTIDELSVVTSARGRALSGVLSSFSKRRGRPIVIKAGTVDTDRLGRSYARPKQLWRLNPLFKSEDLQKIREHLSVLIDEVSTVGASYHNFVFTHDLKGSNQGAMHMTTSTTSGYSEINYES